MGITPKFTEADVKARFTRFIDVVKEQQIKRMQMLGEKCVMHARLLPPEVGFHDQTGNLRSSIGYMIFDDGVPVFDGWSDDTMAKMPTGIAQGRKVAMEVGAKYPEGIVLVVVAGMNYAAALEAGGAFKVASKRGYDVLASAEIMAERELPVLVAELVSNINKATAV